MRTEQEIKERINKYLESIHVHLIESDMGKVVAIRELEWVLGVREK